MSHIIHKDALSPAPKKAQALAHELTKGNNAVLGVLFYGSGLWKTIEQDTVLDFYLLVDNFKSYGAPLSHRFWGSLLPPNVYYAEKQMNGEALRCKYAVMTLRQFTRAARGFAVAPSIFARFAQPCRLIAPQNKQTEQDILRALEDANRTFHRRTLPLLKNHRITAEEIWQTGLSETYKSELRSEKKDRNASIYEAAPESFKERTALYSQKQPHTLSAAQEDFYLAHVPFWKKLLTTINTPIRRYGGKLVTLLRLVKAPLTFDGAVDYIVWKIERHSGQKLEPTTFQRNHPLIAGWPLLFKVLKNKIAR